MTGEAEVLMKKVNIISLFIIAALALATMLDWGASQASEIALPDPSDKQTQSDSDKGRDPRWLLPTSQRGKAGEVQKPVAQKSQAPYDIRAEREKLWKEYQQQKLGIEKDLQTGQITSQEAQSRMAQANEQRFAEARIRGKDVEGELEAIMKRAKEIREAEAMAYVKRTGKMATYMQNVQNTGTPLSDPGSRGIFGDQDLTFGADADRAALVRAAKERKYTVKGKLGEGYVTIEELDIVAHGPNESPVNPLDPQARLQTQNMAGGHESFATRGARYPYLKEGSIEWSGKDALGAVADNIKKVEHDLRTNPAKLGLFEQETWAQNLAKGTMRAMEGAGKSAAELEAALAAAREAGDMAKAARIEGDLEFLKTLKTLKTKMDPRAAGLIPVGSSDAEAGEILEKFQQKCLQQHSEAYQAGLTRNERLVANMDSEIARLIKSGEPVKAAKLMSERAAIIDGAAQAVQHLATAEDGGKLLAEVAFGSRLTPTIRNGRKGYLDQMGRFVSEAEVRAVGEQALNDARVKLGGRAATSSGAAGAAEVGLGNMSKMERGMLYLQAILAAKEGAEREDAVARKEKRTPSYVRAYLEALAVLLGKTAYETGLNASNKSIQEEFERIDKMIKAGQDPNLFLERIKTLGNSLLRTALELSGMSGIVEELHEMLDTALNMINGPEHINDLVRMRANTLAAALEGDLSELNAMLPGMEELYPKAEEVAEEVRKSAEPLEQVIRSFEQISRDVAEYDRLATWSNLRKMEIDALRQDILASINKAEALSLDIYRNGGELCRSSRKLDAPAGQSSVVIPPRGFPENWNALRETAGKREQAIKEITAKRQKLQAMVKEYNDNNAQLELLDINARPMDVAGTLPDLLEDVKINASRAMAPVSELRALARAIESRAQGMRRRAEMLYSAKVMEDRALEFMVQADRILEKIKIYNTSKMAETVSAAFDKYPGEVERITEAAEKRQAIMEQGLAGPIADLDASDIDMKANAAATLYAQADKAYNDARGCAEKVLGSMAVPLQPQIEAQTGHTGSSTGTGKPKEEKPWVYSKFDHPLHLYRFKKETKDVSLMLARSVFEKDGYGLYMIPDGSGGVYHEDCELSGPYGDEAALCAVLRGYGKNSVSYIGGASFVECPKDGPTAQPTIISAGVAPARSGPAASAGPSQIRGGPVQIGPVKGSVQIVSPTGVAQPANSQSTLAPGSGLQTGKDGEVSFHSPGGTTVSVGPGSAVRMSPPEADGKRRGVELLQGRIEVSHPPGTRDFDDVMIHSVDGSVVADGTRYRVEKESAGTRVQVFEGSVHLTGDYIIRTYAPGIEGGKPSPVKEMKLKAGEQALMVGTSSKPQNVPSWLQTPPATTSDPGKPSPHSALTSDPGKPSTLPSWIAPGAKPSEPSPLAQPDPWNNAKVQQLIDQWIAQAIPPSNTPGVVMHYNEWLQPLSQAARSTGPPDHPADWTRYRYAWENRMRYNSINLCSLGEFLERSISGKGTADCTRSGASAPAPAKPAAPPPASPQPPRVPPPKEPQRPAEPPKPAETPKPPATPPPEVKKRVDFTGSWKCIITNPADGKTAEAMQNIYRDNGGRYQLYTKAAEAQFQAKYVEDNRIGFIIGDGTTDKDIYLDFEMRNNNLEGTDRVVMRNGKTYTYAIRCTKIGIPGGRK
ncbi:MAG: hypothetical protein A2X96_11765 [Syntrophobacterales bacterium GWC2_56_13]|nr:MAG: hypothetical protein A2X96_11765 [Syntrophobacterales bacterium GWC2_56_13]